MDKTPQIAAEQLVMTMDKVQETKLQKFMKKFIFLKKKFMFAKFGDKFKILFNFLKNLHVQ